MFLEITKRHTNRKSFEKIAIEVDKLQKLKDCINRGGFKLDIITISEGKNEMANLLARAHGIQLGIKHFEKS